MERTITTAAELHQRLLDEGWLPGPVSNGARWRLLGRRGVAVLRGDGRVVVQVEEEGGSWTGQGTPEWVAGKLWGAR